MSIKKSGFCLCAGFFLFLSGVILSFSACSDNEEEPVSPDGRLHVLKYCPAPGQFINELMYCTTLAEANAWAEAQLTAGNPISLGAFGGYLTVRMPQTITNQEGYDFGIKGNTYEGNSEPGIVWVSEDTNQNGIADDPWFELKGSDETTKNYQVTYYRPAEPAAIRWTDNQGDEGEINYLPAFHAQMYYPDWIEEDSYTLTGSMLPPRSEGGNGIWKNHSFEWGFADNMGTDQVQDTNGNHLYNRFDISHAIDPQGNPAGLKQIHFVKIQSAILRNNGVIGEVSTEIVGFEFF